MDVAVSGLRKLLIDRLQTITQRLIMKKIIIGFLKTIGLYDVLVKRKRNLDRKRFEELERKNAGKRVPFYSQFLSAGDLVFDVGANVGNRVESFLHIGCKVVAVEPQTECIATLREKFGTRINIVEKGLGEKEEEKTLYIADESTISSLSEEWIEKVKESRFSKHQWNKKVQIKLTTMQHLIGQFGVPAFCKIDVEGFELEVLKGLKQPVPHLSLEYTVPEQTDKLMQCVQYCNGLSPYYKYNFSAGEEMKFELPEFLSFDRFIKFIGEKEFQATGFGDIYVKL
jgi:FkbM family methyltransferase